MDASGCKGRLIEEIKDLSNLFDPIDYTNAITNAAAETGWDLPISEAFQVHWFKERAKRWLIFFLWTEQSQKFKVKQLALDQKFKHLGQLIKKMDADFAAAVDGNPDKFGSVDAYKLFGDVVSSGFVYTDVGQDITYE